MSKSTKVIYIVTYVLILCMLLLLFYRLSLSSADMTESEVTSVNNEIDNAWALFLVNDLHPLPEEFTVQTAPVYKEYQLDSRVAPYLIEMLSAAKEDGIELNVISAYRSKQYQYELFSKSVLELMEQGMSFIEATTETARSIAPAGTSEHNAGIAADIVSMDWFANTDLLTSDFEKTEEFAWLKENCHRFGFILRYPEGKSDVTGIIYEPWHYRFVGVYHATRIAKLGVCLEEYIEEQGE